MHPERAARLLATFGGLLLVLVLLLRGLSLSATLEESNGMLPASPEAQPVQQNFVLSADGSRVTFQQGLAPASSGSNGEEAMEWYSMALEGSQVVPAFPPPEPDTRPFLLETEQLFIRVGDGVSLATGSPTGTSVTLAALSPDRLAMAFVANYPGGPHRLYVLYTDEQLDWLSEEEAIDEVAWSPDGEYLAYTASREGIHQIFRIDRKGNNLKQLTADSIEKQNLLWLADGSGLAYVGIEQSAQPSADIFLVSIDASNQRRLTNNPQREFSLSRAGNISEIVYTVQPDGQPNTVHHLYLIAPQTGQQRRVYPPLDIKTLNCPDHLPRGSTREIQFELENSSLLPSSVPVIFRSSSLPLPLLGERQENASRIERIDVPPGTSQKVVWNVHSKSGLTTHVSVLIDLGEQFPMAEQHCVIANTYLGLPNLSFLPVVLPFSAAGMLLTIPWLRHQKKRWLWISWMAYPVVIIILIAFETSQVVSPDIFSTIFTKF